MCSGCCGDEDRIEQGTGPFCPCFLEITQATYLPIFCVLDVTLGMRRVKGRNLQDITLSYPKEVFKPVGEGNEILVDRTLKIKIL